MFNNSIAGASRGSDLGTIHFLASGRRVWLNAGYGIDVRNSLFLGLTPVTDGLVLDEATLKLQEAKLGADQPDMLGSRSSLARAYIAVVRNAEAIALLETNLRLEEKKLGADHHKTGLTRGVLARAYTVTGRTAEAIALHEINLSRGSDLGTIYFLATGSGVWLNAGYGTTITSSVWDVGWVVNFRNRLFLTPGIDVRNNVFQGLTPSTG